MQRLFTNAARVSARRGLSTMRTQPQQAIAARWAVPVSLLTIGAGAYYLSSPVALDTEKKEEQEAVKDLEKEVVRRSDSTEEKIKKEKAGQAEPKKESKNGETKEGEEGQSAAYNPDTGEINWDCPCLGGMAHGPCGEEFKEAFSCFVFSEAEPKGFDCIEKFKNMQNCFRKYPDVYSEEIRGEDEPVDDLRVDETPSPGAPANDVKKSDAIPATTENTGKTPTGKSSSEVEKTSAAPAPEGQPTPAPAADSKSN